MDGDTCDDKFSCLNENDEDTELDDWLPKDADLIKKMVSQIEYYLSDENLAKDAFLLKHVRRNKMGYVNIKLLTSFKKMKHLTKDWRVTAYALRHSTKLEVNEEGNKVRRIDPVPESVLSQVPSRLLLIWNISGLPLKENIPTQGRSSMEMAICLMEPYGSITTVRVNRPGRELPPEIQKYTYRYPELFTQESVLVEFEDLEGAGRAYHHLSQSEGNLKVVLVGKTSKKKVSVEGGVGCAEERSGGKGVAILNRRMEQLQSRGEDSSAYSSSESEFACSSPLHIPRFSSGQICSSPWGSPRSSPRSSPRVRHVSLPAPRVSPLLASAMWGSPDTSPELGRRNHEASPNNSTASVSPWVQRGKLSTIQAPAQDENPRQGRMGTKRVLNGDTLPAGVLRLPYGPDGSRGFHATVIGRRLHHSLKI
ncbi:la-related protein 6-like [Chanos chanos]|uniref:La-related protein 6-like n=1 Tax=Chanos chanos TaxID=29144 RepID=A0A6J2UWI8_CHACN|nr:la-related protein 6-like [Chanos chanos]